MRGERVGVGAARVGGEDDDLQPLVGAQVDGEDGGAAAVVPARADAVRRVDEVRGLDGDAALRAHGALPHGRPLGVVPARDGDQPGRLAAGVLPAVGAAGHRAQGDGDVAVRVHAPARRDDLAPGERDEPLVVQGDAPARRRGPAQLAPQHAPAQVEHALVRLDRPVGTGGVVGPDVDRLAVDGPADPPRVDDRHEALLDLGVGVRAFRVRLLELLVHGGDEGRGVVVGVRLVERAADADVPVGEGQEGRGRGRVVDVEGRLPDGPRGEVASHAVTPPRRRVAHPSGACSSPVQGRSGDKCRSAVDFCLLSTQLSPTC